MKRKASAVWSGGLKDGKGILSSASGALDSTAYSFATRFEDKPGTNPEELIAAAHAGCFSMALSAILGESGIMPGSIKTTATVAMEKQGDGFAITESRLEVRAKVPGISEAKFMEAANKAKEGCPVSKALNVRITMDAMLE